MVGANMAQLLDQVGGWDVTIVSRRAPEFETRARHVACDMSDPDDCARVLGAMNATTHIFWTGHATGTRWVDKAARDTDLFRNAMTAIEPASPHLVHVCLLQGSKYYGRHLGPFKTPAKESDARHFPPNFYYTQEDFLKQLAEGKRWSWSLMRPHIVCGYARTDINLPKPIAVYATLCKKLGLPFTAPVMLNCSTKACCGPPPPRRRRTRLSTWSTATISAGSTCGPALPSTSGWKPVACSRSTLN